MSGAAPIVRAGSRAAAGVADVGGSAPAWWARTAGRVRSGAAAPQHRPAPTAAVLCAPSRARTAAAGVALALAQAMGVRFAVAAAVGGGAPPAMGDMPAARRGAARLRERGLAAASAGRLVWLADRREAAGRGEEAPLVAAMSAELGRAVAAAGVPASLAIPFPRTGALDRVLAWHDAIVVVREPGASDAMLEHVLASLGVLGRPVAAMAPPARLPAMLAAAGMRVPVEAAEAIARLGLEGAGRRGR